MGLLNQGDNMKTAIVTLTALTIQFTAMASDPAMEADRAAVNSACSAEASTANCGDQKVGSGLLKCIQAHKKSNKDFKISDSCKASMKSLKKARHERHEERMEEKKERMEHRAEMQDKRQELRNEIEKKREEIKKLKEEKTNN